MSITYAIADLHGRFDLLCEALSIVERHAGDGGGTFVVLGDMVDRGPASRSILNLLIAGPLFSNWRWVVLKGNHEDMMSTCCRGRTPFSWWLGNGGASTCKSYGYQRGDPLEPFRDPLSEHLAWIEQLPLYHEDEHHVFVHAGLDHEQPLSAQSEQTMLWKRYGRQDADDFWGRHVVHGHHQFASGPILTAGRTDLDTYAWSTGRLAIGVFDDDAPGGPIEILWAEGPAA